MKEERDKEQEALAAQVKIFPDGEFKLKFKDEDAVCSMDVAYTEDCAFVSCDIMREKTGEWINTFVTMHELPTTPYQSGYFAYYEGPLLLECLQILNKKLKLTPSLVIVDGHGLAHPRKFGIACWLGLKIDIPTIGVAKKPMIPHQIELGTGKFSIAPLLLDEEVVGVAFRSNKGVKPIYISPGHLISLDASIYWIKKFHGDYRIFEPIRRADQAVRKAAKGEFGDYEFIDE
ncbi:endonuclease V [Flammeovirga sp. MY04]|uniref:endonuclease V n=1 Tax=Flammeovirga sp. MY04 TaxID=1191459 RepID=UPI0008062F76|nr:endonuclease V [Flammeovirga sp. MY04]ANQ49725.1 endonuclease V [Flammeovirga sp. MY04]